MNDRVLAWDGCTNVRDLGGLKTSDARTTRFNSVVRSDTPARLSPTGWSALHAYGIRTIITLRTVGMVDNELDFTSPYPDLMNIQAPIEDLTDKEFLQKWAATDMWCTPLYFTDALQRWPQRHAAVISAIARAEPGAVLFHCIRGHDRTGIISLLLLALVGVTPDEIITDYLLSADQERDDLLAAKGTSVREVLLSTLGRLDVESYLGKGGVSGADLAAVRKRLIW